MYEQTNQPMFQSTSASDHAFLERGFDPHRPIHTRGGEDVVLLTTNGPGPAPVIGIIFPGRVYGHNIPNGAGKLHRWNYRGKSYDAMSAAPRSLDLEKNTNTKRDFRDFNWRQPFLTRGGRRARLVCSNRQGECTHVCLVEDRHSQSEKIVLYYPNGTIQNDCAENELDLFNL